MVLEIRHEEGHYHLTVSPPDASESRTAAVETPTEAMATLGAWGCHSTDITDALDATGRNWRSEHDAEVIRRRQEEGSMKQRYLVCYDYGQGGVWAYIAATSPEKITAKYPQLTVVTRRPVWMTAENEPDETMTFDIDVPASGWLTQL